MVEYSYKELCKIFFCNKNYDEVLNFLKKKATELKFSEKEAFKKGKIFLANFKKTLSKKW